MTDDSIILGKHSIYVWNGDVHGIPDTLDEALEIYNRLSDSKDDYHSPAYQKFLDETGNQLNPELQSDLVIDAFLYYAANTASLEGHNQDYFTYMATGQEIEEQGNNSLYYISMPDDVQGYLTFLECLVDACTIFNTVIYDERSLMFVTPDGRILPPRRGHDGRTITTWDDLLNDQADADKPISGAEIAEDFIQVCGPELEDMGLTRSNASPWGDDEESRDVQTSYGIKKEYGSFNVTLVASTVSRYSDTYEILYLLNYYAPKISERLAVLYELSGDNKEFVEYTAKGSLVDRQLPIDPHPDINTDVSKKVLSLQDLRDTYERMMKQIKAYQPANDYFEISRIPWGGKQNIIVRQHFVNSPNVTYLIDEFVASWDDPDEQRKNLEMFLERYQPYIDGNKGVDNPACPFAELNVTGFGKKALPQVRKILEDRGFSALDDNLALSYTRQVDYGKQVIQIRIGGGEGHFFLTGDISIYPTIMQSHLKDIGYNYDEQKPLIHYLLDDFFIDLPVIISSDAQLESFYTLFGKALDTQNNLPELMTLIDDGEKTDYSRSHLKDIFWAREYHYIPLIPHLLLTKLAYPESYEQHWESRILDYRIDSKDGKEFTENAEYFDKLKALPLFSE